MIGYDISWASFHVLEVFLSSKSHLKAIGYLAAVQSFKTDTDVLMLTTNTLKKVRSRNWTSLDINEVGVLSGYRLSQSNRHSHCFGRPFAHHNTRHCSRPLSGPPLYAQSFAPKDKEASCACDV